MTVSPLAQVVFLAAVFFAASGLVLGVSWMLRRGRAAERIDRLVGDAAPALPGTDAAPAWVESAVAIAGPLAKLSVPDEGWEDSVLRRRFVQAGLRQPHAPVLFFGTKTALAVLLPFAFVTLRWQLAGPMGVHATLLWVLVLSAIGFYLPNLLLRRATRLRQREIFENFPDALDLLTICVEAGLGLDAALNRVAEDIRIKSPVLADELTLVALELRSGAGKERALRNLALRTGVEEIETLVAMLIQSDRFGTSIGESLRVHADMLRTKRRQRAEEAAAKLAVKLIFPLVLCIFPSILIVVGGPSAITIVKTLPSMIGGM